MRTFYVNGEYIAENEATVSVMDRGFLFADAVYEVTAVIDGKLTDFDGHIRRLQRSLGELEIPMSLSAEELLTVHRELVSRNHIDVGLVYMQISRGVAERDFAFPPADTPPTVVLFTQAVDLVNSPRAKAGLKVKTDADLRWQRGDIKTVQLLYASWVKSQAIKQGFDEVWMVRDGLITEGTSNNAFIVTTNKEIITRQISNDILAGITRAAVMKIATEMNLTVIERAFSTAEAQQAVEAFVTSAGAFVMPVVEIDGQSIGDGKVGEIATRLRETYIQTARESAI